MYHAAGFGNEAENVKPSGTPSLTHYQGVYVVHCGVVIGMPLFGLRKRCSKKIAIYNTARNCAQPVKKITLNIYNIHDKIS